MTTGRRFRALVAYRPADVLRAQRAVLPAIVFVVLLVVLVAHDRSAAPGPWPVTVLAHYATGAWLALAAADTEDPDQRAVTTAAAGGAGAVVAATVVGILALEVPLAVLGATLPAVLAPAGFPTSAVVAGLLAHLAAAVTGTAVGLLAARPLVPRVGRAALAVALVVVLTATAPRLPPVGDAARVVDAVGIRASGVTAELAVDLAVGCVVLAAAATVAWAVARRCPR